MARRRLSTIILFLFVLIVILTSYSYLNFGTEDISSSRHQIILPPITNDPPTSNHQIITLETTQRNTRTASPPPHEPPPPPPSSSSLTRYGANLNVNQLLCPKDSGSTLQKRFSMTNLCPKVFIVGAKKGGTTSLYQYLSKHPDFKGIRLNEEKWVGETFFFAQKYGQVSLKSYLEQFPRDKMSGDASVDNLLQCKVPMRILRTCGKKVKIIILLRNPIQRYVSNFMMRVTRPNIYSEYSNVSSIHKELTQDIKLVTETLEKRNIKYPDKASDWHKLLCLFGCCQSMLYEGLYHVFVMNWLCNFPKENIMFVNSEEMSSKPTLILQQVMDFVGLKPLDHKTLDLITSKRYNQGVKPFLPQHTLSSDNREQLLNFYSKFNDALLELLDWKQIDWS